MSLNPIEKVQQRLDNLARKTYRDASPTVLNMQYHWIFGFTKGGKKVLWGPYTNTVEAERDMIGLQDSEIFTNDTRDVARATREIKAILLARGENPDEALRRVLHKKVDEKKKISREERIKGGLRKVRNLFEGGKT